MRRKLLSPELTWVIALVFKYDHYTLYVRQVKSYRRFDFQGRNTGFWRRRRRNDLKSRRTVRISWMEREQTPEFATAGCEKPHRLRSVKGNSVSGMATEQMASRQIKKTVWWQYHESLDQWLEECKKQRVKRRLRCVERRLDDNGASRCTTHEQKGKANKSAVKTIPVPVYL